MQQLENKRKLEILEEGLKIELEKLAELDRKEKELKNIEEKLLYIKEQLFTSYKNAYSEYENIIEKFDNRIQVLLEDELVITGKIYYNFSKFRKSVIPHIHGNRTSNWNYEKYYLLDPDLSSMSTENSSLDKILEGLNNLFDDVVNNNYTLNKSVTPKSFLKILFTDYFYDFWEVQYKNDKLGAMSTGKASFVILMLIVALSNSKSPLLIDQPEDNLDNRSISSDLVKYIRDKKIERQIILVTHNPNIVVNADAENVIVAHQKGQNAHEINSDSPFTFDYINGALEHSKAFNNENLKTLDCMGIREHITDIVEGGEDAFIKREQKYNFKKSKKKVSTLIV